MDANHLVDCKDWLRQGDLFAGVPCPWPDSSAATADTTITWRTERRPALLVVADCEIDKKKAELLLLAPARLVSGEPADAIARARNDGMGDDGLGPHSSLYIGVATDGNEYFCRLSETFYVPVGALGTCTWRTIGPQDDRRILPVTRLGTLPQRRRILLRRKLVAFWAGVGSVESDFKDDGD